MRIQHDAGCLWWKDWHSCSCGYLEEEIRNEKIALLEDFTPVEIPNDLLKRIENLTKNIDIILDDPLCALVIPGTFIMCGEGVGEEKQYCSRYCWNKAKGEK